MNEQEVLLTQLSSDTLKGLSDSPKHLSSKYFYDEKGSQIFQDIMNMPEYYLTNCEYEIFSERKNEILNEIDPFKKGFEIIELGAGDGLKTTILLEHIVDNNIPLVYIPIDISPAANDELQQKLARQIPQLSVKPVNGDYFTQLKSVDGTSVLPKVIFFLGANIGNFNDNQIDHFLRNMASYTHKGDKLLIGFDLKKEPETILKAYNDPHGHTSAFNLNLLTRINRELDANFDVNKFKQHSIYDPSTGYVKSFLVSLENQVVTINALEKSFHFKQWETIFTEISRKFDTQNIEHLAQKYGFEVQKNFTDRRDFFVDSLWVKV
jgi:dimethylhistidine N-methyltransferase